VGVGTIVTDAHVDPAIVSIPIVDGDIVVTSAKVPLLTRRGNDTGTVVVGLAVLDRRN
jgi:hypothetical protein